MNGTDPPGNSGADNAPRGTTTRRDVLQRGVKLAWVAPVVSTFYASQAYAANYSCYGMGHACAGAEPCCEGLACNDGVCSDFCVPSTELCYVDSDCCSNDCDQGVCQ